MKTWVCGIVLGIVWIVAADAVTKCVNISGTIVHGGLYNVPTNVVFNGADWSNTVGGINYTGVSRHEGIKCYCKIISPVITSWEYIRAPISTIDMCADSCATAGNGLIEYTVIQ